MRFFKRLKKRKIFIQANCQSHAIKNIFSKLDRLNEKYEFLPVKPVHLWKEEEKEDIFRQIKEADIFLHQPVFEKNFGIFASENLAKYLKRDAVVVSFPNLYFTGYHPQAMYLKDKSGKKIDGPFDYHDRNIIKAYKNGLTVNEVEKIFFDDDFYSKEEIEKNIEESLKDLEDRERFTTIKMAHIIRSSMKGRKLFHIFNHPTNEMIFVLVNEILERLEERALSEEEMAQFPNEMLGQIQFPIYKSVQKYFGIDEEISLYANKRKYFPESMLKAYYEEFDYYDYIDLQKRSLISAIEEYTSMHKEHMLQEAKDEMLFIEYLVNIIKLKKPFSLIRLGDGEGNTLFWNQYTGVYAELANANMKKICQIVFGNRKFTNKDYDRLYKLLSSGIDNADVLGLPTVGQEKQVLASAFDKPLDIRGKTGYLTIWNWMLQRHKNTKKTVVNSHAHKMIGRHIGLLLDNNIKISVITCYPELLDLLVTKYNISKGDTYVIPPQASNINGTPSAEHFPHHFNMIIQALKSVELTGSVFLVGAGILGKAYCSQIKDSGGIAIDIGSLMDVWMGKSVRPYHDEAYIQNNRLNA